MSWPAIKKRVSFAAFYDYAVRCSKEMTWKPDGIVVHNTWAPTIAQWKSSNPIVRLGNMEDFYKRKIFPRWKAGPHVFTGPEPQGIYLFSNLREPGTHSPSWNKTKFGVEMVGNFDVDRTDKGDGLVVWQNTVETVAILCFVFELQTADIRFHRQDPKTKHKDCPGKNVWDRRDEFIHAVRERKLQLMKDGFTK